MAEEMRKSKLIANKKYKKYYCSICHIFTNSENQLNQHLDGIRHQQRKTFSPPLGTDIVDKYDCNNLVYIPAFIILSITSFVFCYTIAVYWN